MLGGGGYLQYGVSTIGAPNLGMTQQQQQQQQQQRQQQQQQVIGATAMPTMTRAQSGGAMGSSLGGMSGGIGTLSGLDSNAFMQQGGGLGTNRVGYGNGQTVGVNSLPGGPTTGNASGLYRSSADLLGGNSLLRSSSDGALQYDNSNFPVLSGW